jgi:putative heme-binding domain-containing protein
VRKWCNRTGPIVAFVLLLKMASALAQGGAGQTYSAAEVNAGASLYRTHCASCHGAGGDQIPVVNLLRGKFVSSDLTNDENIADVIMNGTRDGLMPPTNATKLEALHIVAYLRSAATSAAPTQAAGNAESKQPDNVKPVTPPTESVIRGKMVFEKSDCLTCHRLSDRGAYSGPDLSDIAFVRSAEELTKSLLDPDAEIVPHNRSYRVVSPDGAVVTGRLLNHDTFRVQLIDANGRLLSFAKANLREYGFVAKSPMPSYRSRLSAAELSDLVAYLTTLKRQ